MKDDLDEKIITELAALKPKTIQLFGRQQQRRKKSQRHKKVCCKKKT